MCIINNYAEQSAFSCIESEYEADSLVSQISKRKIDGAVYHLDKFRDVITASADNDDIPTIHDLKDKIVVAASISGLASGQMQFCAMINANMSFINNPTIGGTGGRKDGRTKSCSQCFSPPVVRGSGWGSRQNH